MITERGTHTDQFLSLIFNRLATRRGRSLLALTILPLLFLIGCEKPADQSAAQSPTPTTKGQSPASSPDKYQLGTVIRFNAGGGSERFRQSGWSETERDATWTTGTSAKLAIPIGPVKQPLNLRMSLASLGGMTNNTPPGAQPVEVFVNGQKIADWDVFARADFNAVITPSSVKDGEPLIIELRTPKAASPKSVGLGEDARVLGVYCFELTITASS